MTMIGEGMQKIIINHWINIIRKSNNYDNIKLEEIKYGLTGIYLTLSKFIIVLLLSFILNIFIYKSLIIKECSQINNS